MKKYVVVLAVGLLVGADKKDDADKELMKFEGEWVAVSGEVNGQPLPDAALKTLKVTVKGNKITVKSGDTTSEGSFTIDPTKKPRQINGTGKGAQGKEFKTIGIYEFDGGKLKICETLAGGERPKQFSTKGGTQKNPIMLMVYQRARKGQ